MGSSLDVLPAGVCLQELHTPSIKVEIASETEEPHPSRLSNIQWTEQEVMVFNPKWRKPTTSYRTRSHRIGRRHDALQGMPRSMPFFTRRAPSKFSNGAYLKTRGSSCCMTSTQLAHLQGMLILHPANTLYQVLQTILITWPFAFWSLDIVGRRLPGATHISSSPSTSSPSGLKLSQSPRSLQNGPPSSSSISCTSSASTTASSQTMVLSSTAAPSSNYVTTMVFASTFLQWHTHAQMHRSSMPMV
jgi:hypothetical protein